MFQKRKELTNTKICIITVATICAIIGATGGEPVISTMTGQQKKEQIILDAGHGGMDGGAVGIHQEIEKDINLAITQNLRNMLVFSGVDVVMTRSSDISIHDDKYKTASEQKRSDIRNRLKLIEKNPNCIALSIHQNKFQESSSAGAQMFFGKKNPKGEELAGYLQTAFVENLQAENTRQVKAGPHSVYLLEQATVPMVLVECGFLSNEKESILLTDEEYQQKVAFTIYSGLMKYLQEKE